MLHLGILCRNKKAKEKPISKPCYISRVLLYVGKSFEVVVEPGVGFGFLGS